ncbi:MAG: hypothetical protein A3A24_01150, partial [Candidatus Buchananbacteria bacterium RIFCSPLOWO2_01_FULL_46_12]
MNALTKKKVYFLLSAGWGPVVRALPIANQLKEKGIKTYFHVAGKVADVMIRAGHEQVSPDRFPQKGNPKRDWWTLDQLLADFGWHDRDFVHNRFAAYRKAIEAVKPDALVVDFNTAAMLAARSLRIPTAAIVQSCFHPARQKPYIIWWQQPPDNLPTITPLLNEILEHYGASLVSSAEELQIGDVTVIPSFPEFDPLLSVDDSTHYVGPILGNDVGHDAGPEFSQADKLAVVYPGRPHDMGGESGALIMRNVVPALVQLGMDAIVSRGEFDYPEYNQPRQGVVFSSWVSLPTLDSRCVLIVHHGGHGACLSGVQLGIPGLVIPTFAERAYNARNLESLGCAISLSPENLSPEAVAEKLSLLQTNSGYTQKAIGWRQELANRNYGGADKVA